MAQEFDPYHRWLGIPPAEQPANHYRLLGLSQFESDPEVIRDAASQRMAHVRTYQLGPRASLSQKILNELGEAKACLLEPKAKAAYDQSLRLALSAPEGTRRPDPLADLFADVSEAGPAVVLSPVRRRRRLPQRTLVIAGVATGLLVLVGLMIWGFRSSEPPQVVSPEASGSAKTPSTTVSQPGSDPAKASQPQTPVPTTAGRPEVAKSSENTPLAPPPTSTQPPPLAVAPFSAAEAKEHQRRWADCLKVPVETVNSISMKLVLIPPGEFMMGSSEQEVAWASQEGKKKTPNDRVFFENVLKEMPKHRVKITKPIYFGAYHVTQSEFEKVMGVNPSAFMLRRADLSSFKPPLSDGELHWRKNANVTKLAGQDTNRHPVDTVSWEQATEFCRRLSAEVAERDSSLVYRLPTEAEWEHACRAGTATHWYCGDDDAGLGDCAYHGFNSGGVTHPAGEKRPNAWGLYDMHGNLWQWCSDSFTENCYRQSPLNDPTGPTNGIGRVLRGGSWSYSPLCCRSAYREVQPPEWRISVDGFRVVRELPEKAVQDAGKSENPKKPTESPLTASQQRADSQRQLAAAQAILRLGGWIQLAGSDVKIAKPEQLPSQPFQIIEVGVEGSVTDRNFDPLEGIATLRRVRVADGTAHEGKAGDGLIDRLSASRELVHLYSPSLLITGNGLKRIIESFPHLTELDVSFTLLSDEDLRQLSALENLKRLWIAGNVKTKITDRGMHYIGQLKQLEVLNVQWLPLVTDKGFLELANLTALKSVAIDRRISDQAIAQLKKKFPDCKIEIEGAAPSPRAASDAKPPEMVQPAAEDDPRAVQQCVDAALNWLARHQARDGNWSLADYRRQCKDASCTGPGTYAGNTAGTALALLAFLAAGHNQKTEGSYRKTVHEGLFYLKRHQARNGDLSGANPPQMYVHGLASIAMGEAYGLTHNQVIGRSAQQALAFIQSAQHPRTGGWRYTPGQEGDTSAVGWQVMALKSAQMSGLQVNPATLERAKRFLKSCSTGNGGQFSYTPGSSPSPSMTAAGLNSMMLLGLPPTDASVAEGVKMLSAHPPSDAPRNGYYWYYATQVMQRVGGSAWDSWRAQVQRTLMKSQVHEGCSAGSWDPDKPTKDAWGEAGGRIMVTSLSAVILEIPQRRLAIYDPKR